MAWPSSTSSGSAAALRLRRLQRQHPAGDRARHRERRERPARRDRLVLAIEFRPRVLAGAARRHQRAHAPRRLAHQPEAVAADAVHVRIDDGDRRRHRDHRLERIAAFGEHGAAGFRRGAYAARRRRRGDVRRCGGPCNVSSQDEFRACAGWLVDGHPVLRPASERRRHRPGGRAFTPLDG